MQKNVHESYVQTGRRRREKMFFIPTVEREVGIFMYICAEIVNRKEL